MNDADEDERAHVKGGAGATTASRTHDSRGGAPHRHARRSGGLGLTSGVHPVPADLAPGPGGARPAVASLVERVVAEVAGLAEAEPKAARSQGLDRDPPAVTPGRELGELAVAESVDAVVAHVTRGVDAHGVAWGAAERIAAAARYLGDAWERDMRSFVDVTEGLATLERAVRALAEPTEPPLRARGLVLLTCPAGEQHTLGAVLLGAYLRGQGWDVVVELGLDADALVVRVRALRPTVVGISAGGGRRLEALEAMCERVREAHPELALLLGGAVGAAEIAGRCGAVVARDAREAATWLDAHLPRGGRGRSSERR